MLFIVGHVGSVDSFLLVLHDDVIKINGNIFRVTGLLCGEFIGYRWIPRIKAGDVELWCIIWSAPEPTVEQTK